MANEIEDVNASGEEKLEKSQRCQRMQSGHKGKQYQHNINPEWQSGARGKCRKSGDRQSLQGEQLEFVELTWKEMQSL